MVKAELKKMDMHVHTDFSTESIDWGVVKISVRMFGDPVELYHKAKKTGMDYVTFTDHNTIDGCLYLLEKMPHVNDFIIGEEIRTYDPEYKFIIHVNVYGITRTHHRRITRLRENFPKLIRYLKEHNILYSYNHPFWHKYSDYFVTIPKPLQRIYEIAKNFPLIEGSNSFRLPKQNQMAITMAKTLGLNVIAGSDCHGGSVGRTYTMAKASSLRGFMKEVKLGRTVMGGKAQYNFKDVYQECMNVFYANVKRIRADHPSRKVKLITFVMKPITKFFVKREIKKDTDIQKKILGYMGIRKFKTK